MTDQELRDLVAENSRAIEKMRVENDRRIAENEKSRKETEKQLKKVSTEIGWIGNTFGRFTEGLFLPSLERILIKDFGLDTVAPRINRRRNGTQLELDVLAYDSKNKDRAVVFEIKSKLADSDIREFLNLLKSDFPKFFPEHKGKTVYGMLAAVTISPEQKARLEKEGIYVVRITDDVFRIISGKKFQPKDFGLRP